MLALETKKSKQLQQDNDVDANPIDIIADVLIGLMDHESSYWRTVAKLVFGMLASRMQDSTIDFVLTVRTQIPDPGLLHWLIDYFWHITRNGNVF